MVVMWLALGWMWYIIALVTDNPALYPIAIMFWVMALFSAILET